MQEINDGIRRWAREVGAEFFRTLNALVEPAMRAGCVSPGVLPTGKVLLETTGAKSGLPRRVPTPRPATQMLPALARGVDPLAVASVATLTSCTSILWP